MNAATPDFSKIRHDLRSPIHQIIGYCELLLEDEATPPEFVADLRRILAGGRQLVVVLAEYFDDESSTVRRQDLFKLHHDMRTPVNHIIGYAELLEDMAAERATDLPQLARDLWRIRAAARLWLALMEEHLLPAAGGEAPGIPSVIRRPETSVGAPVGAFKGEGRILIVDDEAANREILARRLARYGYAVVTSDNGTDALDRLHADPFDMVLLDLLMPGIDGYEVLSKIKSDPGLQSVPVLMISGLDQENGIARCIEAGAEDYLTKPFNPVMLRARIGACLERKRLRDQERATYQSLVLTQRQLAQDLAEAGDYVKSLLPSPLASGAVRADWRFHPSAQLGGDAFGYHWLDDRHFAVYLLDVSGHGVGAALLSVSVLNLLRSQSLPHVDFSQPAEVVAALNRAFPMEAQNNLYFTFWYGVVQPEHRRLDYSSAGHPPAFLWPDEDPTLPVQALRTRGAPVGCLPDAFFEQKSVDLPKGSRLVVLSDGAYEVCDEHSRPRTLDDFERWLEARRRLGPIPPSLIEASALEFNAGRPLEDDLSVIRIDVE